MGVASVSSVGVAAVCVLLFCGEYFPAINCCFIATSADCKSPMDPEAPGNASDTSGNPEVSWWCKILTRVVASIAGVGE